MLTGKKTVEISSEDVEHFIERYDTTALEVEEFAIHAAINLIAGAISKCEFRTFENKKEIFSSEYYLWNVQPNINQNSSQFLQELISRLLYFNECLVIEANGQLIIAENFTQTEYALYPNTFTNVSRGTMSFYQTFSMSDVLYFRLNNTNIKKLLSRLCSGYGVLIKKATEKYERSGGRKGTLEISTIARADTNFQKTYEKLMQERFKSYFTAQNAVLPLFEGFHYNEQQGEQSRKTTSEINDIKVLVDEAFDRTAQAFRIPPALLKGNIADVRESTNNTLTFCIDPIVDMISEEIIRKRYGEAEYRKGNYIRIDTTCILHKDVFGIAEKADKLIAARLYNPDEIRRKLGDEEIGQPWAKEYVLTKNYTTQGEVNESEILGD